MSWKCNLPSGKSVVLEDLPIKTLERVANEAGMSAGSWYGLPHAPAVNASAAIALLGACAELVGDDPPADDYLTAKNVLEVFERMDADDRPNEYSDGLPVGKEDGPATDS